MPSKFSPDGRIVPGTTWTVPPLRFDYAILRQGRFVAWGRGNTAEEALDLYIGTMERGEFSARPGPWNAVTAAEARALELVR